jgi:hypothetical protein
MSSSYFQDSIIFHFIIFFKATSIFFSVILSSAEVASSNIKISGFFKKSRAIDILCFSPQESFIPLSQMIVLIPCGKSSSVHDIFLRNIFSISNAFVRKNQLNMFQISQNIPSH